MSRLEEALNAALDTQEGTRLVRDTLHHIANALQEAIGICGQLRDEPHIRPECVDALDASLARAVDALRRLQPPSRT
jgi:hypothetical protein